MGNCQTVDAAALLIQHPSGTIERLYSSISASEVMNMNAGHYVSVIMPLPDNKEEISDNRAVGVTRVKLLRPSDSLVLGQAYRLITTEEVMEVLRAKRNANTKKSEQILETADSEYRRPSGETHSTRPELKRLSSQAMRNGKQKQRPISVARSKSWRPSLHSISESAS